jgi:hypothetical protein
LSVLWVIFAGDTIEGKSKMQQEIMKRVTITKIVKEGLITYNMQVDPNIDRDELVGILTQMTQNVLAQGAAIVPQNGKESPEYIG